MRSRMGRTPAVSRPAGCPGRPRIRSVCLEDIGRCSAVSSLQTIRRCNGGVATLVAIQRSDRVVGQPANPFARAGSRYLTLKSRDICKKVRLSRALTLLRTRRLRKGPG